MKKDPKITNDGANDAFVFMSVKVPKANVKTANADGTLNAAANQDLFTYSVNAGWKLIKTNASAGSTEYIHAYAGDKMTVLKPGETTATIFDTVKFINSSLTDRALISRSTQWESRQLILEQRVLLKSTISS